MLSILMTGRDDDYMPDFRYRLTTTLNSFAATLARLGHSGDVEVLVTDWGSHVPMADTIKLSPEAARISRFLTVSPTLVRNLQDGRDDFHISLSLNVGLRRAKGEFVMVSAADTLFTAPALDTLFRLLSGNVPMPVDVRQTYFLCRRYHVPWQYMHRQPILDEWNRYLMLHAGEYEKDQDAVFGISAGAGALLMSRAMWHELRGLDERLGGWGFNDVELGLRVSQVYPWMDLSYLGIAAFHMQHEPGKGRRATATQNWQANPRIHNVAPQTNDEDWGAHGANVPVKTVQNVGRAEENTLPHAANASHSPAKRFDSFAQVERHLVGPEIRRDVEKSIKRVKSEYGDWEIDRTDLQALFLLAWYSRHHFPRRYLEFGIGHGYSAMLVGDTCPSVEIYGIDRWEGECHSYDPSSIGSQRLATAHCGYLRFVNGDPNTGLNRLRASIVGPCSFDLILLREECVDDAKAQLSRLLDHLAPNGALVIRSRTARSFESLWSDVRNARSGHAYLRPLGANAGLIINAEISDESETREWENLPAIATKPLESLIDRLEKGPRTTVALAKVARALTKVRRYPEYAGRVVRWLEKTSQNEYGRQ